ncbi:MAG: methionyl-tRNA formyltransferase [Candidatus Limnocylindrus sp.]
MPQSVPRASVVPKLREPTVTKHRLILIGSGAFGVPSFAAVAADPRFDVLAVITPPARASGRAKALTPTPVAHWATAAGLRVIEIARIRNPDSIAQVLELRADAALLVDFGQIIPHDLLSGLKHGVVNLHPSLLPRHRGASPIPASIVAGDAVTGVTMMLMDEGVDTGPTIHVVKAPIDARDTAVTLEARLAVLAADWVSDTLAGWLQGTIAPVAQSNEGATTTGLLDRDAGRIIATTSAVDAYRRWRAYQPWPGVWVEGAGIDGRLILAEVGVPVPYHGDDHGAVVLVDNQLLLVLADGALPLLHVKPAGGRSMSGGAYARGRSEILSGRARITP